MQRAMRYPQIYKTQSMQTEQQRGSVKRLLQDAAVPYIRLHHMEGEGRTEGDQNKPSRKTSSSSSGRSPWMSSGIIGGEAGWVSGGEGEARAVHPERGTLDLALHGVFGDLGGCSSCVASCSVFSGTSSPLI